MSVKRTSVDDGCIVKTIYVISSNKGPNLQYGRTTATTCVIYSKIYKVNILTIHFKTLTEPLYDLT
ncbi:hypothetical protein Hanom_Chr04g00292801 [Helianthus anomalus]